MVDPEAVGRDIDHRAIGPDDPTYIIARLNAASATSRYQGRMEVGLMWAACRVLRGSLRGGCSESGAVQQGWEPIADTQPREADGTSAAAYRRINLRVSMIAFRTS